MASQLRAPPREASIIGVFEFIVLLVLISTLGKVLTARQARPQLPEASHRPEEILQLNDAITELNTRLEKLEEERDFYRALLEPPARDDAQRLPGADAASRPPDADAPRRPSGGEPTGAGS